MEGKGDSPLVDMRTEINGPTEDGKFQVTNIKLIFILIWGIDANEVMVIF